MNTTMKTLWLVTTLVVATCLQTVAQAWPESYKPKSLDQAREEQKRAAIKTEQAARAIARYPDEWRLVNETNYNVAVLRRWYAGSLQFPNRPLPDWEFIRGVVVAVEPDCLRIEAEGDHYEPLSMDRSASNGLYPTNRAGSAVKVNETLATRPARYRTSGMVMVKNIPNQRHLTTGAKIDVLAARIGEQEYQALDSLKRIPVFDYGMPTSTPAVQRPKSGAAAK